MGGKTTATSDARIAQLAVQTSSLGLPITRGWGRTRVKCNLIWYNGFQAIAHTETQSSGGKGMGGKSSHTSYSYTASIIMGVAAGPITGIPKVFRDKEALANNQKTTTVGGDSAYSPETGLQQAGLSLATGALTQTPWSYVTSKFLGEARAYPGLAYVYAQGYALSDSASLSNHSFEVDFAIQMPGLPDADPKDILTDFLENSIHGVPGWMSGLLGDLTMFSSWCRANNLLLSPALEEQRPASEIIDEWMDAVHCAAYWSEGQLKVGTFGDSDAAGNGATFIADLTPVYDLTEDDLIPDDNQPVVVDIQDQTDAYNVVQVEYLDRANGYNVAIATADDLAHIEEFGERKRDPVTRHCICDGTIARKSAEYEKQRILNRRDTYRFKLPWNFGRLDCMDYVTLTTTSDELKLDRQLVQIEQIDEGEDDILQITAVGIEAGTGAAASYSSHSGSAATINTDVAPGAVDAAQLINAPASLTGLDPEVWCAVTATNPAWGGCEVWISADNLHYQKVGTITAPARMGVSTNNLPDHTDPDSVNMLGVDLGVSGRTLETATAGNANAGATLFWLGGEIMGYQNATLTSADHYDLTTLRRGLHGTPHNAHVAGSSFVRLDDAIFKIAYNDLNFGQMMYLKFPSFNVFGSAREELSTAIVHSLALLDASTAKDWREQATAVALGANQFVNSHLSNGLSQWALGDTGVAGNGTIALASGKIRLASAAPSGGANDSFASLVPYDGSALRLGHHLWRVTQGQRVAVRLKGSVSRANAYLSIYFRFLAQTPGSDLTGSGGGTAFTGFSNVITSTNDELAAWCDVPAGAFWLDTEFYATSQNSTAAVTIDIEALELAFIDAQQTVPPAWNEGPSGAYGATRNVARGVYAAGTAYEAGDMVTWDAASGGDGNGYIRINSGSTTGIAPSNSAYWAVSVQRGSQGLAGSAGNNAKLARLTASAYAFLIDAAGVNTPASITLTASGQYVSGSPSFSATPGSVILTGTGNTRSLTFGNMATDQATIEVTWDGQTDSVTISKLRAGAHGVSFTNANGAHVLPASNAGVVSDYAGSGTTIQVYEGATALTFHTALAAGRFTIGTPTVSPGSALIVGARSGSGTATCTVANHGGASNAIDVITVTYPITARRADGTDVSFNIVQTLSKSKAGVDGSAGAAGAAGYSYAELTIYSQSVSAPSAPSGGSYDFGTKITTPPSGWVSDAASFSGANPVYMAKITAVIQGASGTQALGAWSAPGRVFASGTNGSNGSPGADGVSIDIVYRLSATQPSTPGASAGVPSGWGGDPASAPGSGILWASTGERPNSGANYIWQTPVQMQGINGTNGVNGTNGTNGANGTTFYSWYSYADSSDGSVNFSTGSPGNRTWQGVSHGNTSPTESGNPADYSWTPYTGPSSVGLAASSGAQASSNKLVRTAGYSGGWDEQIYSTEGFFRGATVKWQVTDAGGGSHGGIMVGLNSDPLTNSGYDTIDHAWYAEESGSPVAYIYENGGAIASWSRVLSDTFSIVYDNDTVRYYQNGTLRREVDVAADQTFYMDSSIVHVGARGLLLDFSPVGAKGQNGAAGANGTSPYLLDLATSDITIQATSANVTKSGQVPRTIALALMQGMTNVTGSATVTLSTSSGDIGASYASGVITIITANASGFIDVSVLVSATVVATARITIGRLLDAPAGTTTTGVQQPAPWATFSNSYTVGTGNAIVMRANSSGQLHASIAGMFGASGDPPFGSSSVALALVIRPSTGGTWTYGPEDADNGTAGYHFGLGYFVPANFDASHMFSGLAAGSYYEVSYAYRMFGNNDGANYVAAIDSNLSVSQ